MRGRSVLCLVLLAGCTRTEEQPIGEPRSAAEVLVPTASSAPSGAPPAETRCLSPMLTPPPPRAAPAARCPPDDLARPPSLPRGRVIFAEAPGRPEVEVELAIASGEQSRGLMFRRELPPNQGMLFWGEREMVRTFWMHNTCIPLDMLFVAEDLVIVGILEQVPVLNEAARKVPCESAHVLELNAGWARDHGVNPGQRVIIER